MNWIQSTDRFTGIHWLVCADISIISAARSVGDLIIVSIETTSLTNVKETEIMTNLVNSIVSKIQC